jgi:hypothetical protein
VNIKGKELAMTEILRDIAAFASMTMFIAMVSVILMAL